MSSALRCINCGVLFAFGHEQDRVQRFLDHDCVGEVTLDNAERRHPSYRLYLVPDGAA